MRYLIAGLVACGLLYAQEQSDLEVVGRIKAEAFENSQVMDTAELLTDRYGPRLTASPEWREAADWAVQRLQSYGLSGVRLEKWGSPARAWTLKKASLELVEPRYSELVAAPLAWSDVTHGIETAEVVFAPYGSGRRVRDPKRAEEEFNRFAAQWKGKLKGKVVLMTPDLPAAPDTKPAFHRYSDEELRDLVSAPAPTPKVPIDPDNLKFPETDDAQTYQAFYASLPPPVRERLRLRRVALTAKRAKFFKDEGVVALVERDQRAHDGLLFAEAAGPFDAKDELAPPTFIVTEEQYGRMVRLLEHKNALKMRVSLEAEISRQNADAFNVVGEIPGTSKANEVVMLGAHFDSWHTGTGATDNAAGSVVMMEAVRILKALNLKMDRTVRIALWSGEEEGLLGSEAYVKAHFGDPETMQLTPEHAKLTGYFNLDNGSGKVRGVYLQGNDAMRPVFAGWLEAFRDQGVSAITIRNTGGTDHLSFDAVGLPGFQFIQDPLDYDTQTHHSDVDTFDHLQAADLMQAAAVVATVVYDAANRPEMLPRKELPRAWSTYVTGQKPASSPAGQ